MSMMVSFVLSFFPRDVLDEILNLIGSVSEGFPSYFCRDSKLLVMEKMRRQFCFGPYGRFAIRLLLRSAATDNIRIYTVNSIQTDTCLGQNSAQKIV